MATEWHSGHCLARIDRVSWETKPLYENLRYLQYNALIAIATVAMYSYNSRAVAIILVR